MTSLADLEARVARLESRGLRARLNDPARREIVWQILVITLCGLVLMLLLSPMAGAAGVYVHRTSDPAYVDDQGAVVQDPYRVDEGAGARNVGQHVVYTGPLPGDTWQQAEADGWPYQRTRALLTVRFPPGVPGRFHFDHDAAAQLLARGLTVDRLDRLWLTGSGPLDSTEQP